MIKVIVLPAPNVTLLFSEFVLNANLTVLLAPVNVKCPCTLNGILLLVVVSVVPTNVVPATNGDVFADINLLTDVTPVTDVAIFVKSALIE